MRKRADKQAILTRREEAVTRNAAWAKLSTEAKIASLQERDMLAGRGGQSKKQIAKLEKLRAK